MNNEQAWEEKYQEGYGNNYVESHIVRCYFHLLRREFSLKSGKMFDWGMGNGLNAEFFSRQGLEVSGCDVSASAVEQARLRMPHRAKHFYVVTPGDDSFGIDGGGV
jgi:2-polyprenyl-3-methyl-5-hydroxy-6-metoxy-1,4-benzoquinol methylase